jgi:hypothetical protein
MPNVTDHPVEARKLYLRLVKHYHPDISRPEQRELFTTLMQHINAAWDAGDIAKLLDIEAHGVVFLTRSVEKNIDWINEAAEWARMRTEAIGREIAHEAEMAARSRPIQHADEAVRPKWGPRPAFSYIVSGDRAIWTVINFFNFWNPCSNWVVTGSYLYLLRSFVQRSIVAAWMLVGVWLCLTGRHSNLNAGALLMVIVFLARTVGYALVLGPLYILCRYTIKSVSLLTGALFCAYLIVRILYDLPWAPIFAYGIATGFWAYKICIDEE